MVIIMRHARYSVPVFVDVDHLTLQYNIFRLGSAAADAARSLLGDAAHVGQRVPRGLVGGEGSGGVNRRK